MPYTFFLEPELGHDGAEAAGFWALLEIAEGDDLGGDLREGEELRTGILETGGREVDGYELLLAGGDHEGLDVLLERLDVIEVEPVVEAVLQQVERLCEHAVVGQGVLVWRVDVHDVEGQPKPLTVLPVIDGVAPTISAFITPATLDL